MYNSISGYSTTRLTGLSSGLDTDALVKASMTAQQSRLDTMYKNKTRLEWQRDAYTDVRSKVQTFSSKYLSSTSKDNVFSRNVFKQYKATVSDKYDSYFGVKATSNAQISTYKVSETKLASKASIKTAEGRNRYVGTSSSVKPNAKMSVAGTTTWYADDKGTKLADEKTNLNDVYVSDGKGGYVKAFSDNSTVSGKTNGKAFSVSVATGQVGDLVSGMSNADTQVSFENGKLSLSSKKTGEKAALTFEGAYVDSTGHAQDMFGAKSLTGVTSSKIQTKNVLTSKTTLGEINGLTGKNLVSSDGKIAFSIKTSATGEAKKFEFDEDSSIQNILDKVNGELGDSAKLSFDETTGEFTLKSTQRTDGNTDQVLEVENIAGNFFGGDNSITGIAEGRFGDYAVIDKTTDTIASAAAKMGVTLNGDLQFKLNGKEFTFSANTKLEKMMSDINAADVGARISYTQVSDSFQIESADTGSTSSVKLESMGSSNAFEFFGVLADQSADSTSDALMKNGSLKASGDDALMTINGQTIRRSSNTFTVDGVEFTIKDDWKADDNLGKATVTIDQDIDAPVEAMKNFVKDFNELVDSLYGTITEQRDYDYDALTEDERDALEKEDIEKYEAEAKKGVLHGDSTIRTFLSRMRSAIFESVGGLTFNDIVDGETANSSSGLSANDLGFSTSKYATGEYGGKIVFDEDKFREALKRDPETVANVMAAVSDASDEATEYKESGFITKIQSLMNDFSSTIRSTNLQNTNDKITSLSNSMDDQIKKMSDYAERLYQQYAQLETLMSQYQSQSQWLTNQLSSLQS